MRNMIFIPSLLLVVLFVSSCSSQIGTDESDVVQWDALKELDEQVEHLEEVIQENDMEHVREHVEELKSAAQLTVAGPIPHNAHNPEEVKQMQMDLKSIMDSLTKEVVADDELLKSTIMSIHPIVEQLMEKSGVPHVHDHDHDHDHDEAEKSNDANEREVH